MAANAYRPGAGGITEADEKRSVLVVDDERDNREMIEQVLSSHFKVILAADGEAAVTLARSAMPDIILLDITMPKMDGITACEILRTTESTKHIPIIILTAMTDADIRIKSYMTGADDFMAKPFRSKELLARVISKVRRLEERSTKDETIVIGNLVLNLKKIEALVNEKPLGLSVLEFNLLKCFAQNKDRVMSRETILDFVWRDSTVSDRTVDTHIVSLRKKLDGFDHTIATVYGAGYVLKKA